MTDGRDELSTADLASQQPSDPAPRRDHEAAADSRDADHDVPLREDARDDRPGDAWDPAHDPAGGERGRGAHVSPTSSSGDVDDAAPRTDQSAAAPEATSTAGPLLAARDAEGFRARWTDVQTAFVDSPRQSVEQADALVAEVMQHLAKTFADERSSLERQWDRGDDIPTDDLRTAFQRYRSFFERLLAT